MGTTNIYLIGAGFIAGTHAQAIAKLDGADAIRLYVTDPNEVALARFLDDYPGAIACESAETMLAQPADPHDIAIVTTPPSLHYPLSLLALQSGRHVLCEKPLAMDAAQADLLLEAAQAAGRRLGCCSSRFLGIPTNEAVKEMLRANELGDVYRVRFVHRANRSRSGVEYQPQSRWFLNKRMSGGGVLMDWGPYDFACLNDVLNPVKVEVLSAWTANPETALDFDPLQTPFDVEQHVGAAMVYHMKDGRHIHVTYERAACTHGEELQLAEIEGSRGAVNWDWLSFGDSARMTVAVDEQGRRVVHERTPDIDKRFTYLEKPLAYFHGAVNGRETPALLDERAVFNFRCLRAVYDCAAGGRPVTVSLAADPGGG